MWKILAFAQIRMMQHVKCIYSPFEKASEKNPNKTIWCFRVLHFSNKTHEIKQIKSIVLQNQMNYFILDWLKTSDYKKVISN